MPLPTKTPRLATLDPAALAQATCRAVLVHLQREAAQLVADDSAQLSAGPASALHKAVVSLCAWAQAGRGDPAAAWALCLDVARTVYPGPRDGSPELGPDDLRARADPETDIGLVLVAASARLGLLAGEPVSTREIAALASLSQLQIQNLIRGREIRARGAKGEERSITAAEARRFLSARGVAGF